MVEGENIEDMMVSQPGQLDWSSNHHGTVLLGVTMKVFSEGFA